MIVSVRHWTFLRPVQRLLRAVAPKASEKREARKPSSGFLSQFEAMMGYQVNLAIRGMDKD